MDQDGLWKKRETKLGDRSYQPVLSFSFGIPTRYIGSSATLGLGKESTKRMAPCLYLVDMPSFLEGDSCREKSARGAENSVIWRREMDTSRRLRP